MKLKEYVASATTGLDAIQRAPIVDYNTGLKCIRIQDISKNKPFEDWGNTDTTARDYAKYKLCPNDILVARTGATVGVSYIFLENYNAVFNNGTIRLKLKDNCNPRFIYYVFQTHEFMQYINNVSYVSTQPNLRVENLLRFYIPDFSILEQNKIADILSKYDTLVANNNKRIKILEQMAASLYKEWFVHFRFPGSKTIRFKQQNPSGWTLSTKINNMVCPEHWSYCTFAKLGNFKRGQNITAEDMIEGVIPVISAGIEPSGFHNIANINGKSLTISSSGANAGYLKYHLSDIWAADCSYFQDTKNLWFVYNTLKFLQPVINNMQVGAAQPHVYPKNINKLCIIIPDDVTIQAYCDKVNPMYEQIHLLTLQNQHLISQRELLIPRLMSGKLKV